MWYNWRNVDMAVTVKQVIEGSLAQELGIVPGDRLLKIDGNEIGDVLDYQFYARETSLTLLFEQADGPLEALVEKDEDEDLGLEFETYLMDKQHSCTNNCIFCFVDQMPQGMRESLYFKDDDERLSFLFGNYVTLTNLKQKEIDRIIKMHISPINISVHTTNPQLRCRMMGNRFAGQKLDYIRQLAAADIHINCQIVLCPGLNDGEELTRTMTDLSALWPSVSSVAVVPVGLTGYRQDLFSLQPFDRETAAQALDTIHQFTDGFLAAHGTRLIYPADEFFVLSGRELPGTDYYGDFEQLENGVGMTALLLSEFKEELARLQEDRQPVPCDLVTGQAPSVYIHWMVEELRKRYPDLACRVHVIENNFFGGNITVTGLVTATDIIDQVQGKLLSQRMLVPSCMLRHEQDKFLDDCTREELEQRLGVSLRLVENDGYYFIDAVLGGN